MKKISISEFESIWRIAAKTPGSSSMDFLDYEIMLDDQESQKRIWLKGDCNGKNIIIKDCNIPSIWFEGLKNAKNIIIQSSVFDSMTINNCDINGTVDFFGNKINMLEINGGNAKHVSLQRNNQVKNLAYGVGKWDLVNVFSPVSLQQEFIEIENIKINFFSTESNSRIYINSAKVLNVKIGGVNIDSRLVIDNCMVDNMEMDGFRNERDFLISNIFPLSNKSNFNVFESDMGKGTFENIDFNKFDNLEITRSSLSEIKYYSIEWPKKINLRSDDYRVKREAYRQLKIASEKQGDRVQALIFERNEIENYRNELKGQKNRLGDKIILWTNYSSNNHGQNWIKALFWILGFTVVFHAFIQISLFGIEQAWIQSIENFPKIFLLLNPVHDAKIISSKVYDNLGAAFTDSLSRIVIGYLIFQLIRSFRKYTRV